MGRCRTATQNKTKEKINTQDTHNKGADWRGLKRTSLTNPNRLRQKNPIFVLPLSLLQKRIIIFPPTIDNAYEA